MFHFSAVVGMKGQRLDVDAGKCSEKVSSSTQHSHKYKINSIKIKKHKKHKGTLP